MFILFYDCAKMAVNLLLLFLIVSVNLQTVSVLLSSEVQHRISCNLQSLLGDPRDKFFKIA